MDKTTITGRFCSSYIRDRLPIALKPVFLVLLIVMAELQSGQPAPEFILVPST